MSKSRFAALVLMVAFAACEETEPVTPISTTKLSYFTDAVVINGVTESVQKTSFSYDSKGRPESYKEYIYNTDLEQFVESQYYKFTFSGDQLQKIEGFHASSNEPSINYTYQYLPSGKVSTISEQNFDAGLTAQATFSYSATNTHKVTYSSSNGNSFDYLFTVDGSNLVSYTVNKGALSCSEGNYSYDEYTSPFSMLGYLDFYLRNLSVNNKLTEENTYMACSFPDLIPESHTYEYDEDGFPLSEVISYKGSTITTERTFVYHQ